MSAGAAKARAQDCDDFGPERCLEQITALGDYSRYLPEYVSGRFAQESEAKRDRILRLLSVEPAPPCAGDLLHGLRCLRQYEEQTCPLNVGLRADICRALWRLLQKSVAGPTPLYGYTLRTRLAEYLASWLLQFTDYHFVRHWMDRVQTEEETAEVQSLRRELDVRLPIQLIVQEMGLSMRLDNTASSSKRRNWVFHLMYLCMSMGVLLEPSAGQWLVADIASRIDAVHCYSMMYARLLVVLTPVMYTPKVLADGTIWSWWATMPEGLLPKFDLMWFAILARYAELRWAGNVAAALDATQAAPTTAADCEAEVTRQMPWLFNKICRVASLPFGSPAANAIEGNKAAQAPPDPDRYTIPEEIDSLIMGHVSTWNDVAKFIVYLLDASPPKASTSAAAAAPSDAWGFLELLLRRMTPFATPANSIGEWLWHCVTLTHFLVSAYFRRVCRERLLPCRAPAAHRLTKAADERFVALFVPLVSDFLQLRSTYELSTAGESMARLAQIAAMHTRPEEAAQLGVAPLDPFAVTVQSLVVRATEVLHDPAQSDRHCALLQICLGTLPALLMRWPSSLGGILPVVLWGIDPTDSPKTLLSAGLLFSIFARLPCVDTNDWLLDSEPGASSLQKATWRWPYPAGSKPTVEEDPVSALVSSTLPGFAMELMERLCDYVSRIPKPAKGKGVVQGMGHFETLSLSFIHAGMTLVASQSDRETYLQLVEAMVSFVNTHLLPDQVKPMALLVAAVARARPEVSLPVLLPALFKKLLPRRAAGAAAAPLHEAGGSESEAVWYLGALTAAVRHAGPVLLDYRADLEAVVRSALLDNREAVPKLGAKLLRRILFSITATYVKGGDYRICGGQEWEQLMAGRCGSAPQEALWPLRWAGAAAPWWARAPASVQWHVVSECEAEWAQCLTVGALQQVGQMLQAVPLTVQPGPLSADKTPEGAKWLEGLASRLPEKKKASHGVLLSLKLVQAVLRGTCELWSDERTEAQLQEQLLPPTPLAAEQAAFAAALYGWLGQTLLAAVEALSAQEQQTRTENPAPGAAPAASIDPVEVPRVLTKVLKSVGELLGALRLKHSNPSKLFPSPKQVDVQSNSSHLPATVMEDLHPQAKWRDLPRVWWVIRVHDVLMARKRERVGGHRYVGWRRSLIEALCKISFSSGFQTARRRAQEVWMLATRYHVGVKWPLAHDILLPALAAETEAAARCASLTGEAATREHRRLNDALAGLALALTGLGQSIWRRGVDDAASLARSLCEAIYASTKVKVASGSPTTAATESGESPTSAERCEVTSVTVAQLIVAVKHWLDHREVQNFGHTRAQSSVPGEFSDEEEAEEPGVNTAGKPNRSGEVALEVVEGLLSLCERPDCHWRAQVMATAVCLGLRGAMSGAATAATAARGREVWMHWTRWLVRCCEAKAQPSLHALGVQGLTTLLKRPAPLVDADLLEAGLADPGFCEKLLAVMPHLHHESMNASGDRGAEHLELTRDTVVLMTSSGTFRLWPRGWMKRSSRTFVIRNALFWQTFVGFLSRTVPAEALAQLLQRGAAHLASQPASEAEFHAAFTELFAGAFRSLRKDDAPGRHLRSLAWSGLAPLISQELQKASQERLEEWCDAVRFVVRGCSRPMLKGPIFGAGGRAAEVSRQFLMPLLNFVVGSEGVEPSSDELVCSIALAHYEIGEASSSSSAPSSAAAASAGEGGGATAAQFARDGSSFDAFKRLRLLMALLVEPSATDFLEAHGPFCARLAESLRPGVGHPYTQLREEVARALFLLFRASGRQRAGGLGAAAALTETWLGDEAQRLLQLLRADNAAPHREEPQGARARHVVESLGVCYTLLHTALSRLASLQLSAAIPRVLEFLLAGAAHGDFELRLLSSHALALCCSAHPVGPPGRDGNLARARSLRDLLRLEGALQEKEREKALAVAVRPTIMANFFLLSCEDPGLLQDLREAAEEALGHPKPEVRAGARSTVASFLALDREAQLKASLVRLKASAGSGQKRAATFAEGPDASLAAIAGLACALLAAADCGVPRWTGQAIEVLAPYSRPGMAEATLKEVQGAIQVFLKVQQSNRHLWKECQAKLTPSQLELLNDSKGKLSYFS